MPLLPTTSASFRNDRALRGARSRARELGILGEFWERVSAGDLNAAMGLLALAEERAHRRRVRRSGALLAWGLASGLFALGLRIWSA